MDSLKKWFDRFLSNPEALALVGMLLVGFLLLVWLGNILAPVLASIVIAYLLEGMVERLGGLGVTRKLAVIVVFCAFLAFLAYLIFGLLPMLSIQTVELVQQLPAMINKGVAMLMHLPSEYPELISETQMTLIFDQMSTEVVGYGQELLSLSASSFVGLVALIIYLFLVPMLVYFFLMDKKPIIGWLTQYLPSNRALSAEVFINVNQQVTNYVRGKIGEILIVWVVCFVAFSVLGLKYAMLLSFVVGISVLIPYVGATVVTLPVILVAYFQWQWSNEFLVLVSVFFIIQALDGYVLVPLLFSEVVNIHPVAIIVAILFFGGVWGFWGIFFAIPLATLVQAVLVAWPRELAQLPKDLQSNEIME